MKKIALHWQIILGMVLGVLIGLLIVNDVLFYFFFSNYWCFNIVFLIKLHRLSTFTTHIAVPISDIEYIIYFLPLATAVADRVIKSFALSHSLVNRLFSVKGILIVFVCCLAITDR